MESHTHTKPPSMHGRFGSTTLLQLVFSGEKAIRLSHEKHTNGTIQLLKKKEDKERRQGEEEEEAEEKQEEEEMVHGGAGGRQKKEEGVGRAEVEKTPI